MNSCLCMPSATFVLFAQKKSVFVRISDMKVEVFLLFLVPHFCLCDEDFCREARSSILPNHVLVGYVIKSLLTRGIFSCAQKCLSFSLCSSCNYQTSAAKDGVCELNGGSGDNHQSLTEKHGFTFAQVRQEKVRIVTD